MVLNDFIKNNIDSVNQQLKENIPIEEHFMNIFNKQQNLLYKTKISILFPELVMQNKIYNHLIKYKNYFFEKGKTLDLEDLYLNMESQQLLILDNKIISFFDFKNFVKK